MLEELSNGPSSPRHLQSKFWARCPGQFAELRVAHVTPAYFAEHSLIGGGERYVSYVARALQAIRPSLPFWLSQAVFAIGPRDDSFIEYGVPVSVFRNENPNAHPMAAMSDRLWSAVESFDVVHVHQCLTFFGCFCAALARSLGKTLIMTDLGGGENTLMLQHGGLKLADGVLSISEFARSLTRAYFGGPTAVVIGPVDTETFYPPPEHERRQLEILSVGRLLPHKGFDRIIDALPSGVPLKLIGRPYDPAYFEFLQRRAEGKQVTVVTDADDVVLRMAYQTASLYVHASTFVDVYGRSVSKPELMGLTTLEALSSGMPIVVSDTASLPELATDSRISRTFTDVASLAAILKDHAAGNWPGPGASEIARQHAVSNFSFVEVGRRIAEFYDRVHQQRLAGAGA